MPDPAPVIIATFLLLVIVCLLWALTYRKEGSLAGVEQNPGSGPFSLHQGIGCVCFGCHFVVGWLWFRCGFVASWLRPRFGSLRRRRHSASGSYGPVSPTRK